jgi:hypothetical protein
MTLRKTSHVVNTRSISILPTPAMITATNADHPITSAEKLPRLNVDFPIDDAVIEGIVRIYL